MQVVVFGATGFIGKAVVAQLQMEGHHVVSLGSNAGDLRLPVVCAKLVSAISRCDTAIILSALTPKKNLSLKDELIRFMDNMRIMENISALILGSQISNILYVSTDAVYATTQSQLKEDAITNPEGLYGLAHATRERLLMEVFQDRSILIVRPCALYGADDPHNGYGPNRFIREAITKRTITLFGDGEELRNHMYIMDFSKILMQLIKFKMLGIVNVAPLPAITFYALAQEVKRIMPFPVQINSIARQIPVLHKIHNTERLQTLGEAVTFLPLANGLELMYKDLVLQKEFRSSINV